MNARIGAVSASDHQKRRLMSTQLVIGLLVERRLDRLERHAADRARAWAPLPHLRVHRAGVSVRVRGCEGRGGVEAAVPLRPLLHSVSGAGAACIACMPGRYAGSRYFFGSA